MARNEHGAVFTKRWVVDLILDSCGYVPSRDLGACVAVEPACGDGAFLLPMVERLLSSAARNQRPLMTLGGALRAYDVQSEHVESCREGVARLLVEAGCSEAESRKLAVGWVSEGDYLLVDQPSDAQFVVGNPPYIRSDDLSRETRGRYLAQLQCMTIGADIYVGFIERGLRSLAPGGVLAFIVADRWMHNSYGRKLRRFVTDGYAVETVIEMHGVDAFADEVSAYPAIIEIRHERQGQAFYAVAEPSFDEMSASRLLDWRASSPETGQTTVDADFKAANLPEWFTTDDMWPSASPSRLQLLERLAASFGPLESAETGTRVGIGIATGADAIFIKHDGRPDIEEERLLPVVMTRHIRSGVVEWDGSWLANPWTEDGRLVDLQDYPKLASFLGRHRSDLAKRHTASKSPHDSWYRTIDKVHCGLRCKPKLLLQDMKATIQPVLDSGEYYPHHNLYWITSDEWDLEVLGGLLLSKVAQMFVEAYGVKMRGGTLRFQAQYLRKIRVPDPSAIPPRVQRQLAAAFRLRDADKATSAALAAYGLAELPD